MKTIESWRGDILLETVHGSRLYGLDHADSDEDYYVVTEHGPAKQKVTQEADGTTADFFIIGLDSFLQKVEKGTHQAIEALHSREAFYKPGWREYFQGLRTYSPLIEETYDRTIRHLALGDTYKKRRHAVRLMLNLKELREYGKFDPKLDEIQRNVVDWLATLEGEELLAAIMTHLGPNRVKVEREDE